MLGEREVITVAFGNYSSLVAAQWANGTSHFDMHHHTLYTECRSADVLGGSGISGASSAQRTWVPRLLVLDAPYTATFDDVEAWADRFDTNSANHNEEEEGAETAKGNMHLTQDGKGWYADMMSAASPVWSGGVGSAAGSRSSNMGDVQQVDRATRRLDDLAKAAQQHLWAQHGLDEDDEDYDEVSEGTEEVAEVNDYTRLRRVLGIAPYGARYDENTKTDEESTTQVDRATVENEEEEGDEAARRNGIPPHRKALGKEEKVTKLKKTLFCTHNSTTPWWQYITTGLAAHSVTSVKPLQHVDAAGDIPALHSFGYGMTHLRSDKKSEIEFFNDAFRTQLELADQLQGVQCFTDGDGMFGGAAHNVLEQFWEEAGTKTPVVNTCLFSPLPNFITDRSNCSEVAFRERRLDEVALNQLLATVNLSRHSSAVYIPIPLAQWGEFFKGTATAVSKDTTPMWLDDERATAQYVAAVLDTALYGVRDGSNTNTDAGTLHGAHRDDNPTLRTQGPMYYMDDWCRVVRPSPSLRVAAAMGALPQPVAQSTDLWNFLKENPLLPEAPIVDERMSGGQARAHNSNGTPKALRTGFVPLTHAMSTYSPLNSAGKVLGHAVSLRGAGVLPSTVYPTREAMLRYALPLGISTYLPLLTESNYPISASFPMELMFADPAAMERQLPRGLGSLRNALTSVDVGAHVLNTYASAPMLHDIVTKADTAMKYKKDRYCAAYDMESDEWAERRDEALALYDDYHHAAPSDAQCSDGDSDY